MARKIGNAELFRQKAIATTDDLASAGKLSDEQANKFIDYVVDVTGLKNNARIERFTSENMNINKIGVGTRVAMPATEAVSPSVRRGVTTSKVTLTPVEIIVPFEIGDSFEEINVEGTDVEDHVVRMMASQCANDIETLYLTGCTTGPAILEGDYIDGGSATQYVKDSYLAMMNGWLYKARSSNVIDWEGEAIGASLWGAMLRAMPAKFKRDRGMLRFICSDELEQLYREVISSRHTAMGDAAVSGAAAITPYGVPLVPFSLFPWMVPVVQHVPLLGNGVAVALTFAPIEADTEVLTPTTLGVTPTTKYVEGTAYDMDYTNGTIAANAGGSLANTTVKLTYNAYPQAMLTHFKNLIVGIGRDIRIERDRDIFRRTNQFAITMKIACEFEELTAIVWAKNIGTSI